MHLMGNFKSSLICFLTFVNLSFGQSTIIHNDVSKVEIKSEQKAIYSHSRRWTVYSESHKAHSLVAIPYNSFREVKSLSLNIYNSKGERLEKIKQKDFFDQSLSEGFEVDDSRALFYSYSSPTYPVTFELEYVMGLNGLLYIEGWEPIFDYDVGIESGTFTVKCPIENQVKYKSNNIKDPVRLEGDGTATFIWKLEKPFGPLKQEPYCPAPRNYAPHVQLAPNEFIMEKHAGHFKNWAGLGEWCESLFEGRSELPAQTTAYIQQNFGAIVDPIKKTEAIYKWVQGKTRYVSIQLGIGGWQPMAASDVDKYGYGDCKALTNYTKAALKAAGIDAYYSLVYAGATDKTDPAFPSSSFNHAVLSVPINGDTIWLECTNQKMPFGQMGSATTGKYSLVVNGAESKLARVKSIGNESFYRASYSYTVDVNPKTKSTINATIRYSEFLYLTASDLGNSSRKDLSEYFYTNLGKPGSKLNSISVGLEHIKNEAIVNCSFEFPELIQEVTDQIIISPSVFLSQFPSLPYNGNRKNDILLSFGYAHSDSIDIKLPEGYEVGFIPKGKSLNSKFGSYSAQFSVSGEMLTIVAHRELKGGNISSEEYESLRTFLSDCNKLLEAGIVLGKKPS